MSSGDPGSGGGDSGGDGSEDEKPPVAAPHLLAAESAGPEPVPDPLDFRLSDLTSRSLTPQEKWPGEWHAICWMVAHGSSQRQIARELDYSEGRISVILSKPEVQARISQIRDGWGKASLEKRFSAAAPRALDYVKSVIEGREDARTGERLSASQWLLEKVTGKPKQATEVDVGAGVLQLLQALDERKTASASPSPEAIDVTPAAPAPEPKADPLADWVSTHVPDFKSEKG